MKKYLIWGGLLLLILAVIAGLYFMFQGNNDLQERRIELLEEALAPKTAESGAVAWAQAIKTRNGAWQYAIMNEDLRSEYLQEFEDTNWVTGFSSPWVEKYQVTKESESDKGITFKVKFDWYSSAGYEYSNYGTITLTKYGSNSDVKWLISYLDFNYEPATETQ